MTLRSIAARAGISVGRVQHYFPTRQAIILYGLEAMIDGAAEGFRTSTTDSDPRSRLVTLLLFSIPRTDERRMGSAVWYAYVAESVASPAIARKLGDTLRGVEDLVMTMIGEVRDAAPTGLGDHDDRAAARMLLAAADGLAYRVLVRQLSLDDADDTAIRLVDAILG